MYGFTCTVCTIVPTVICVKKGGASAAVVAKGGPVVIGQDARASSPAFAAALAEGLQAGGFHVFGHFLALGPAKADIVAELLDGPPREEVPATLLRDHPDLRLIVDEPAAAKARAAPCTNISRSGRSLACTRPRWREGVASATSRGTAPNTGNPAA